MRPTRTAIALAAAALPLAMLPAAGLPGAWPAVAAAWTLLLVAAASDAVAAPAPGRLACEVDLPGTLHVGQRGRLGARLRLRGARRAPAQAVVDLSGDLEPQGVASGRTGDDPCELRWELVPSRRGLARVERIWIRYASPLRLWSRVVVVPIEREIEVLPDLPRIRSTALRFFADRSFRAGLKIEKYSGDGSEFDSLKEFVAGDDHRRIDWKSSARHRRLHCRQHRAERNHQVVVALDTGRLMSEPLGGVPKLDHAINGGLLLAYVCLVSGDAVGLFTFGARAGPAHVPVRGTASMAGLVAFTSRVAYSRDETNYTLGLTSLAQRLTRRTLVVLLTDFADTATADLMLDNVRRVSGRHLVVFVSIRDPLLGRLADREPGSIEGLNVSVLAHGLLRDRDLVHRRLRDMGVHPLDLEPGRVGPALINRYLEIKRRELA